MYIENCSHILNSLVNFATSDNPAFIEAPAPKKKISSSVLSLITFSNLNYLILVFFITLCEIVISIHLKFIIKIV